MGKKFNLLDAVYWPVHIEQLLTASVCLIQKAYLMYDSLFLAPSCAMGSQNKDDLGLSTLNVGARKEEKADSEKKEKEFSAMFSHAIVEFTF